MVDPEAASALYAGAVLHRRMRPRRHRLAYRVFSLLLDLEELASLDRRLRLFSHNRRNVFAFYDRDHGSGAGDLRRHVEAALAQGGIELGGGPIRLLCYPRIFGYAFNPLSTYFCHRSDGSLAAILYEVTNTYRERHTYLIPVPEGSAQIVRQSCAKRLYVSPFLGMAMRYDFRITPPGERVLIAIRAGDAEGTLLDACFAGRRRALDDRQLLVALWSYPLMTLKVIAGIHWEALRLWAKGLRVLAHVPAPDQALTIVAAEFPLNLPPELPGVERR